MSVVAVKVEKDKITIGADSFMGFSYDTQLKDKDAKLFQQNGFAVGAVGYGSDCALFKLFMRDRKPTRNDQDAWLDYITEFTDWVKKKKSDYVCKSDFMVVYQGRAWLIYNGFNVYEIKKKEAMGAGMNMAQAALALGHSVAEAIDVACELSIYCEKPVNVIEVPR